jgi:predicted nucleotide-binding protein (sugar kinase/HSP70/actin superfamily)
MSDQSLQGRTIYLPEMNYGATRCVAAAFASVGLHAVPTPASDSSTLEYGSRFTSGDECLPERITLGDFLKVTKQPGFDPRKTAFFMPTAGGPCRFGQYEGYVEKVMHQLGHDEVIVFSPSSKNSYRGIGDSSFTRTAWRAFVIADLLQKLLLKTRPYEKNKGDSNEVYEAGLKWAGAALAERGDHKQRMKRLVDVVLKTRDRFRTVPVDRTERRPLIGIIGEIFCRHHDFSNENLIPRLEEHGAEAWISDLSEWLWYIQESERRKLKRTGQFFSKAMLRNRITNWIQKHDEHTLLKPVHHDIVGYEEASNISEILAYSEPYLPPQGCLGEMVLNVGKTIYLYKKGAHGVIDISPFTCMNGIICEAVYPHVSRDHDGLPIRNFYFDGTTSDLDRDLGIFVELARNYQRKHDSAG